MELGVSGSLSVNWGHRTAWAWSCLPETTFQDALFPFQPETAQSGLASQPAGTFISHGLRRSCFIAQWQKWVRMEDSGIPRLLGSRSLPFDWDKNRKEWFPSASTPRWFPHPIPILSLHAWEAGKWLQTSLELDGLHSSPLCHLPAGGPGLPWPLSFSICKMGIVMALLSVDWGLNELKYLKHSEPGTQWGLNKCWILLWLSHTCLSDAHKNPSPWWPWPGTELLSFGWESVYNEISWSQSDPCNTKQPSISFWKRTTLNLPEKRPFRRLKWFPCNHSQEHNWLRFSFTTDSVSASLLQIPLGQIRFHIGSHHIIIITMFTGCPSLPKAKRKMKLWAMSLPHRVGTEASVASHPLGRPSQLPALLCWRRVRLTAPGSSHPRHDGETGWGGALLPHFSLPGNSKHQFAEPGGTLCHPWF